MKNKTFENLFTHSELENRLSGFTAGDSRSIYKRKNGKLLDDVKTLLPVGYVNSLGDKIESAEVIFSSDTIRSLNLSRDRTK